MKVERIINDDTPVMKIYLTHADALDLLSLLTELKWNYGNHPNVGELYIALRGYERKSV